MPGIGPPEESVRHEGCTQPFASKSSEMDRRRTVGRGAKAVTFTGGKVTEGKWQCVETPRVTKRGSLKMF